MSDSSDSSSSDSSEYIPSDSSSSDSDSSSSSPEDSSSSESDSSSSGSDSSADSSSSSSSDYIPDEPYPISCGCPPEPECPEGGIVSGSGGVRSFNGKVFLRSEASIQTIGFNYPFGTVLEYDNFANGASMGFGKNWRLTSGLAGIVVGSGIVTYLKGANANKVFVDESGGQYKSTYFVLDRLLYDAGTNQYILIAPDGSVKFFNSTGKLVGFKNRGGHIGTVTYNTTTGKLESVNVSMGRLRGNLTTRGAAILSRALLSKSTGATCGRRHMLTTAMTIS